MSTAPLRLRLRGASIGGVSALTGLAAHAHGGGGLPATAGLLLVLAAAFGIGLAARQVSARGLVPTMIGAQALLHVLLILLGGSHHELLTTPMVAMHTLGVLVAFALVAGLDAVAAAFEAVVRRIVALVTRGPLPDVAAPVFVSSTPRRPRPTVWLGALGTRGPPAVV
ncbi:MAG: hypothetical protein QM658_12940 [Gordonia sp. (in: high G+C Gram-positive bacteria)]